MNPYMIETRHLTKTYGGKTVVSDLNMHIRSKSIYALLGRNGAGKTTTMKMLLNLIRPTSGEVYLFGENIKNKEKEILPRIGCLIENPGFYANLTGSENLHIFAKLRGVTKCNAIQEALDLVGLPYKDKKLFSQYSVGMKQRLAIALAIMHEPELLILDEPANGLDPIGIVEMRNFLYDMCHSGGKTILISSHILSEISLLADDIGIIDHGVLLEEESMAELERKNNRRFQISVSDISAASHILETQFGVTDFEIVDNNAIWIHDLSAAPEKINKRLVENNIEVFELHLCEGTLEEYFSRVTGGAGIA